MNPSRGPVDILGHYSFIAFSYPEVISPISRPLSYHLLSQGQEAFEWAVKRIFEEVLSYLACIPVIYYQPSGCMTQKL